MLVMGNEGMLMRMLHDPILGDGMPAEKQVGTHKRAPLF